VKRVLLLATTTGYQIRSFGEAAQALGVRLLFASDRCDRLEDPWWDRAIPIRFHDERASVDAIVAGVGAPPDGIVAVGDRPTVIAARAAEAFGLPGNSPASTRISRDKLATRAALANAGLLVPGFEAIDDDVDAALLARALAYPAVVKPVALSGSRGVIRVDDEPACVAAIARVRKLLHGTDVLAERDPALGRMVVEAFVPGREYAVEGLVSDGRFRALAIFDKPDPLDGPFFEETIYVMPSMAAPAVQQAIVSAIGAAVSAIGLRHGPVHAECRVNDRGVWVLEVAARPIGGLCSKALRFEPVGGGETLVPPVSLEELLLRHAIGEVVSGYERERAASGVMMIPIPQRGVFKHVSGVEEAAAVPGVTSVEITAKVGALLVPLPEGKSYLGFIFARGHTPQAVDAALRRAHASLRFAVERELVVV
jgi:biotin carboxylase